MRFIEIASGVTIPVSSEEDELLYRANATNDDTIIKADLDERQQEVARLMCSRGIFDRLRDKDGKIIYRVSSVTNIWTDMR